MDMLAVIPARGGSKGIPRKNLRLLNGKPLIYYQINNVLKSKYINDVVISSDSNDILEYASNFSVHVRDRPQELATDDITLDPVIYDATNYMEAKLQKKYDVVVTLQPTSPLLKPETLDAAIDKLLNDSLDTLIPMIDATHLYWKDDETGVVPDYKKRLNRQWLPKMYKETGAFLVAKRSFVQKDSRFGNRIGVYLLDEVEGLDIDCPLDWLFAETVLNKLKIIFIVNGNKSVGLGHIYRTITLADRLLGHDITFLSWDSDSSALELIKDKGYNIIISDERSIYDELGKVKPDIIINDILDTTREFVAGQKKLHSFIVNFEDLGEGADEAHMVFNALYEYSRPMKNRKFGYEYECLNENFMLHDPIKLKDKPQTLIVTFGGVDPSNMTCRVISRAPEIFRLTTLEKIIVVIGAGFGHKEELDRLLSGFKNHNIELLQKVNNMPAVMKRADLAITSNGRTIYELTSMGIPTISIAQNDRETMHLFSRYHKGIKYLGIACTINDENMIGAINEITNNENLRGKMYLSQIDASRIIRNGINKVINEMLVEYKGWKYEDH